MPLFGHFFSEKCMKIKEIGPRGSASPRAPLPRALDPPMRMVGSVAIGRVVWGAGAMRYERRQNTPTTTTNR